MWNEFAVVITLEWKQRMHTLPSRGMLKVAPKSKQKPLMCYCTVLLGCGVCVGGLVVSYLQIGSD